MKNLNFPFIFVLIILALFIGKLLTTQPSPEVNLATSDQITPASLPGIQNSPSPWEPNITNLKDRLFAIGLPALSKEGNLQHTHQHLEIYVNGNSVDIPAEIGINEAASFIAPIHVHYTDSIIHVESPVKADFTLGQFFDIWGVRFTNDCLGSYCTDDTQKLQLFLNGQELTSNFRDLILEAHQEIVLTYGTPNQLPNPIPATFNFPADL